MTIPSGGSGEAHLCPVIPKHYRDGLGPVLLRMRLPVSSLTRQLRPEMNARPKQNNDGRSAALPDWADCDFFCIHDYAGTATSPCGWRGQSQETRRDAASMKLLCPWCGCATLLRIPLDRTDEEGT